jgi:hypothetical protein
MSGESDSRPIIAASALPSLTALKAAWPESGRSVEFCSLWTGGGYAAIELAGMTAPRAGPCGGCEVTPIPTATAVFAALQESGSGTKRLMTGGQSMSALPRYCGREWG